MVQDDHDNNQETHGIAEQENFVFHILERVVEKKQ